MMPDFNPFDMDLDGYVDGIDFLGFNCLMRHVLQKADSAWFATACAKVGPSIIRLRFLLSTAPRCRGRNRSGSGCSQTGQHPSCSPPGTGPWYLQCRCHAAFRPR